MPLSLANTSALLYAAQFLQRFYTISTPFLHHFFTMSTSILHNVYIDSTSFRHFYIVATPSYIVAAPSLRRYYIVTVSFLHRYYTVNKYYYKYTGLFLRFCASMGHVTPSESKGSRLRCTARDEGRRPQISQESARAVSATAVVDPSLTPEHQSVTPA